MSGWHTTPAGPVAQLGERHNGIVEAKGSNPFGSTSVCLFCAINQGGTAESSSSLNCQGTFTKRIFYLFLTGVEHIWVYP